MDPPHFHPNQEERFEGVGGTPHVMINGKRHVLLPGEHLVVPPGLYRTFGNSTAEVGHAIAAFRPAMNIHQLFVEFFEAFRTSRGLKRQVGSQRCYTATPTHQVPQADAATRCCSGLVTDAQQTALTCLPHGGRWAKSSHVSPLAISRMRPRVNQLRCDGCPVSRPACGRLGYVRCGILWGHTPLFRTDAIRTAGVSRPPD
jgi:Cupin domain